MNKFKLFPLFILITIFHVFNIVAQDTTYARQVIKKLTSPDLLGRGYVRNGVNKSASFLLKEMKQIGLLKFGESYTQTYHFDVNTFPSKMSIILNERKLIAGKHFLIYPSATSKKITCQLIKTDSVTYHSIGDVSKEPIIIKLKKKLTYTVATATSSITTIELLKDSFPINLKSIALDFENKFIPNFKCQNLCGYIKGTEQPDTFIVFTAHYDHLGAMGEKAYFPGANDNASGVSVLLNLMKYYQKKPIKYSVAFILFSGEEAGLLGSKYYAEHPLFPLSAIKFLTNMDLLGTGDDGIMVVNATLFKNQFEKLNDINKEKNYVKQIKQRGKAANSDHYWFTEKGVPSFFIYTMGGIQAYHDIYDIEKTLPLTDYTDVFKLLTEFIEKL